MDKDGELFADEGDVGADTWNAQFGMRNAEFDSVIDAVAAVAGVVEGFAEGEFGFGVAGAVGAHDAGDRFALWDGRSFVAYVVDSLSLTAKYAKYTKQDARGTRAVQSGALSAL